MSFLGDEADIAGGEDVLPASQASLPSHLLLSDDEQADRLAGVDDLPDELPLSPSQPDEQQASVEATPQALPTPTLEQAGRAQSVELAEAPLMSVTQRASLFGRRGRPDHLLLEAMQEAMAQARTRQQSNQVPEDGPQHCQAVVVPGSGPAAVQGQSREPSRKRLLEELRGYLAPGRVVDALPEGGLRPLGPEADAAAAAARIGQLSLRHGDQSLLAAGQRLLGDLPLEIASKKLRASSHGLSTRTYESFLPVLASATVLLDHKQRAQVEGALAQMRHSVALMFYVDAGAYDETPMKVAMRGEGLLPPGHHEGDASAPGSALTQASGGVPTTLADSVLLAGLSINKSGPQKLLQSRQECGMLLRVGGATVALVCPSICPLDVLERNTGTVLREALARGSAVSPAAVSFSQRMRAVCTDRGAPNFSAEKAITADRGPTWGHLHIECGVHKSSNAHERTFALVPENIRGMIHTALALRNGAAMNVFRTCMRDEIRSRFVVKAGKATVEATEHKKFCLRLFCSHGAQLAAKRILLAAGPNGDWRQEGVEHYLPLTATEWDEEMLASKVASAVVAALCSAQPSIYPRHRWTGADLAMDSLGLIESVHRLLSTTFLRFAAAHEHSSRSRKALGSAAAAAAAQPAACAGPGERCEAVASDKQGAAAEPADAEASTAAAAGTDEAGGAAEASWAELNSMYRRTGVAWVCTKPFGVLLAQRQVLEPLRQLMSRQFAVAAEEWEALQRHKTLEASRRGERSFSVRDYRLAIAAKGQDEAMCLEQLRILLHEEPMWRAMPAANRTLSFRALVTRMISRAGCAVLELHGASHSQFLVKLFRLLHEPELGPEFAQVPECMLDTWTLSVKRRFPTFTGEALLHELALTSLLVAKDISHIEARHATIRRLVTSASVQTHTAAAADVSAQWCLLQARKLSQKRLRAMGEQAQKPGDKVFRGQHPAPFPHSFGSQGPRPEKQLLLV